MLEIEKTIKEMIEELKKEYQEGRKKALGEILLLIKRDIFNLLDNQKYSIKMTKRIIEQALKIKISDNTFYKWVERQRQRNYTQKSNIKERKVSNKVSVPKEKEKKETKPIKEVQNVKRILEEVKSTGEEEDFDRNAGKTGFLDDI